jgi:hypothetical protein
VSRQKKKIHSTRKPSVQEKKNLVCTKKKVKRKKLMRNGKSMWSVSRPGLTRDERHGTVSEGDWDEYGVEW